MGQLVQLTPTLMPRLPTTPLLVPTRRRLPSEHPALIKWSAPAFVRIRLVSLGLSLGCQTVRSFTCCVSSATRCALYQAGGRAVTGLEASLGCSGLQHKGDLITAPTQPDVKTVGFNAVRGPLLDVSFCAGSLRVDAAANLLVYGPGGWRAPTAPRHTARSAVAAGGRARIPNPCLALQRQRRPLLPCPSPLAPLQA